MAEEKEKKETEVPKKFEKLVKEIEELKVSDLAELVKILEEKFGMVPSPTFGVETPVAPTGAPSAAPGASAGASEKATYDVELTAVGDKKIEVIKVVRDIVGKGLKEAKDLVDAVASGPQKIKENVKKEEAEEIKKKLTEAGATVELK